MAMAWHGRGRGVVGLPEEVEAGVVDAELLEAEAAARDAGVQAGGCEAGDIGAVVVGVPTKGGAVATGPVGKGVRSDPAATGAGWKTGPADKVGCEKSMAGGFSGV